jgi:hypothetical protein
VVGSLSPTPHGLFTEPTGRAAQAPDAAAVRRAGRLSRVRGLLLGLALGDALTRADPPGSGPLPATATTQLACFTTEGLIRALVHADQHGSAASPVAVWSAYRRWARVQGIPAPRPIEPSGWICRVPALGERRGDAASAVTALQNAHDAVPRPSRTARGHHALSPRLPLAAVVAPADWTREVVLATHGDPDAVRAGVAGVEVARAVVTTGSVADALGSPHDPLLDAACEPGASPARLAPDDSAVSALRGGVALAARCPGPDAIADTLCAARELPAPGAVGPLAGALLGAAHGAESLPTELVTRLELGWTADTLARDLVAQLEDRPGGTARQQPADPHWQRRYPPD